MAYNNMGTILRNNRQIDDAIECFKRAIIIEPKDPLGHYNLGNAFKSSKSL